MSNIQKGKYGEELAAEFLIKSGYKIIDKNYKFSRYGEIDIIALEKDTLCFIEVKTRTNNNFGSGLEAVTKEKLMNTKNRKVCKTALNAAFCAYGDRQNATTRQPQR